MNTKSKTILTAALVAVGLSGAGLTAAQASSGNEANNAAEIQTFMSAPSLMDAVKAAEAKTGGKAMDASFETLKDGSAAYQVELVKADGSQIEALVKADGSVTAKAMAADDMDDHEDGEADDD
ncbi:PepSY domain-containing protein [Pseudooceanicola nitratireducens]|jgi:uncharacterized membrane protein YkoI|uniref:PepSY domain-containing protein n=1 Tax=Pseudooceanicola nitratireducens TaxID=517719 RepID=UPI0035112118